MDEERLRRSRWTTDSYAPARNWLWTRHPGVARTVRWGALAIFAAFVVLVFVR